MHSSVASRAGARRSWAVAPLLTLLVLLPTTTRGAPIGPAGAHPADAAPPTGTVDLYATAGSPALGLGLDVGLGPTVVGLELSALTPGALRPELHARLPFDLGPVRLAPRLALAYSAALAERWRGGLVADSSFELAPGAILSWSTGRLALFFDGGLLGTANLARKAQDRLAATLAAGAEFALTDRFSLGAHLGTLATEAAFRPAGGVSLAYRAWPGNRQAPRP